MDDNTDSMNSETQGTSEPSASSSTMDFQQEPMQQTSETSASQGADGVSEHKLYAILGYILPFLFFLPLLQESSKNNAFARFHANQQLILLIGWAGLYVVSNMLVMILYMIGVFLLPLLNLAFLVLAIIGIINAAQGQMKELPVIGKFRLLK